MVVVRHAGSCGGSSRRRGRRRRRLRPGLRWRRWIRPSATAPTAWGCPTPTCPPSPPDPPTSSGCAAAHRLTSHPSIVLRPPMALPALARREARDAAHVRPLPGGAGAPLLTCWPSTSVMRGRIGVQLVWALHFCQRCLHTVLMLLFCRTRARALAVLAEPAPPNRFVGRKYDSRDLCFAEPRSLADDAR